MLNAILTNAYRPGNTGDTMLVREAITLIKELRVTNLNVISFEPEGFQRVTEDMEGGEFKLNHFKPQPFLGLTKETVADAEFGLAVGGGYLRFGNFIESRKANALHLSQLRTLISMDIPFGMLPQSIGPDAFQPKDLKFILEKAKWIAARDDRTLDYVSRIAPNANVWRCPDLVALQLKKSTGNTNGKSIGVIFKKDLFVKNEIIANFLNHKNVIIMIQSDVGKKNKDSKITQSYNIPKYKTNEAINSGEIGSVVSMRLHGALASISSGIPAIHVATERKGYGVFEDLGLTNFLIDRKNFNSDHVYTLARKLIEDENVKNQYWNSLNQAISKMDNFAADLKAKISSLSKAVNL